VMEGVFGVGQKDMLGSVPWLAVLVLQYEKLNEKEGKESNQDLLLFT
jgi:hypothetical protein